MSPVKLRLATALAPGEHGTYRRHRCQYPKPSAPHTHDYLELFWVERGTGIHWINGVERGVPTGTLQLIRPEDTHTFCVPPGGDFEWTNVALPTASWTALRRRYFSGEPRYFDVPAVASREFRLPDEALAALRTAAAELARGARDRLAFERFLLNALAVIASTEPPAAGIPPWLAELDQDLRQQGNFSRGVAAVVARVGRCAEHVCREYRRHYGRTPTATMTAARMDYAAHQLEITDRTILDLCLDVGLENLGHFYRTFERRFHCTPREYRLRRKLPAPRE